MKILYQFPLSHYCEKARWLLDYKKLDYVAISLTPGVHRVFTWLKSRQYLLPMLHDGEQWIADSSNIALYLDDTYPEHALLSRDKKLRKDALEIDKQASELGIHVRRWTLALALDQGDKPLEIMMGTKGFLRQFSAIARPILRKMVTLNYQLSAGKVKKSKARMDELIATLNQRLVDNQGRYFVGEHFGLADISVCSMLAPLLVINGTPWELDNEETKLFTGELRACHDSLMGLPLGQYVQRVYATERKASVDWRGE